MKKVHCDACGDDITHDIQVYWDGEILCEECNLQDEK